MIQKLTIEDIKDVTLLEESVFNHSLGINFLYDELTINPFAYYFVYKENNIILGYIGFRAYDESAEMLNFIVRPKYQNKGIGQKLFDYSVNVLKEIDVLSISLEVRMSNENALKFYFKNNFKKSHIRKNYYENEDALVLIKEVL